MPVVRRSSCVPLPIVFCPVVAVVKLESLLARCVHCVENVAWQPSPHSAHILSTDSPASQQLQQDRQLLAVERSWISWRWASRCPKHVEILLINNKSLLLHLVGLILTDLSKMHSHSNIKFNVCLWTWDSLFVLDFGRISIMPNFMEMCLLNMEGIPKTDRKPFTVQVRSPDS